jgi:hypothetical protein
MLAPAGVLVMAPLAAASHVADAFRNLTCRAGGGPCTIAPRVPPAPARPSVAPA